MELIEKKYESPFLTITSDEVEGVLLKGESEAAKLVSRIGTYAVQMQKWETPALKPLAESYSESYLPVALRMITELSAGIASGEIGNQTFIFETDSKKSIVIARGALALNDTDVNSAIEPTLEEKLDDITSDKYDLLEELVYRLEPPINEDKDYKGFDALTPVTYIYSD